MKDILSAIAVGCLGSCLVVVLFFMPLVSNRNFHRVERFVWPLFAGFLFFAAWVLIIEFIDMIL